MTTYMVLTIKDGHPLTNFFFDDEESAVYTAAVFIQVWDSECDRMTWQAFVSLRREQKNKEAIRLWNEGRFRHQIYVFKIWVDSQSEVFERLARDIELGKA